MSKPTSSKISVDDVTTLLAWAALISRIDHYIQSGEGDFADEFLHDEALAVRETLPGIFDRLGIPFSPDILDIRDEEENE